MALIPPNPQAEDFEPINTCTNEHCFHAFDALYCALTGAVAIEPSFANEKYPLFVTWNICKPGGIQRLRGCIGSFEPLSLHEGLAEYALISAFRDSRFRKIEERELPHLECGISLLTDFEDASSYLDWTVGVHGIYITFPHPSLLPPSSESSSSSTTPQSSSYFLPATRLTIKRQLSATYLPDVIPDQGWTKLEAIDSAVQKAGWDGKITDDVRRSIKLRRYRSSKFKVTWDEFTQWRAANGQAVV